MIEQLDLFEVSNDDVYDIDLSTRQWKTYNLIKMNSMRGRTTTQREIVDNYPAEIYKDGYVWNNNPKVHDHCSTIWQDINRINAEWNIQKIVIWDDNYNYKIAETASEVEAFCQKLYWEKAMAKLWRHGNLMRKVKRDGQCRLFFKERTKAREFWQTFFDEHIDDLIDKSMETEDEKGDTE